MISVGLETMSKTMFPGINTLYPLSFFPQTAHVLPSSFLFTVVIKMESLNLFNKKPASGSLCPPECLEHLKHKMIQLLKENVWPLE